MRRRRRCCSMYIYSYRYIIQSLLRRASASVHQYVYPQRDSLTYVYIYTSCAYSAFLFYIYNTYIYLDVYYASRRSYDTGVLSRTIARAHDWHSSTRDLCSIATGYPPHMLVYIYIGSLFLCAYTLMSEQRAHMGAREPRGI